MTNARTRWFFIATTFIAALAFSATTYADGMVLDQFQPAPPGDRFFSVQGGDSGGHLLPRLMVLGDYAYKPLALFQGSDDHEVGAVVKNQFFLHVAAGISLWDRLWVFANMPLALTMGGDSPSVDGTPIASPSGAAAGDLRVVCLGAKTCGENQILILPAGERLRRAQFFVDPRLQRAQRAQHFVKWRVNQPDAHGGQKHRR